MVHSASLSVSCDTEPDTGLSVISARSAPQSTCTQAQAQQCAVSVASQHTFKCPTALLNASACVDIHTFDGLQQAFFSEVIKVDI
jgi:hypothetical protein